MKVKKGYLCIALLGRDRVVFWGKGKAKGCFCENIQENGLEFFFCKRQAEKAREELSRRGIFQEIFLGHMQLIIAEDVRDRELFRKNENGSFVVIAKNFKEYDLIGARKKSTARWASQGGNSLRENGLRPFQDYAKAQECMLQLCHQQGGEESFHLALYCFKYVE